MQTAMIHYALLFSATGPLFIETPALNWLQSRRLELFLLIQALPVGKGPGFRT